MTPHERDAVRTLGFLLTPEGARCRYAFARDRKGRARDPLAPSASCWCLRGAVVLVSARFGIDDCRLDRLVNTIIGGDPDDELAAAWDDASDLGQRQLLERLREASDVEPAEASFAEPPSA